MAHDRGRPEGLEELERQVAELLGCDSIEESFARLDPYDEAIFQAFDVASQAHRAARRAQERCDRAGPRIDAQAEDLWRDFGWPLTMAFLEKSFAARHSDARVMYSFAEKASYVAEKTPPEKHPPGVVFDLRARTEIELANALRVNDRFAEAEAALERAEVWLAQGSGDLSLSARLCDVKASLCDDLRRLPEALELLDEAGRLYTEIGDLHLAGRAIVSRARVVYSAGYPAEAVRLLEEGMALLDRDRDPGLGHSCAQALIGYLVESGDYRRAGTLLMESGLGEAFAGEPLNRLRLRWVEARIFAGNGRLERAELIFKQVRSGFQEHGLEYDAALAGLDLAAVWLRQGGKDTHVHVLAAEMTETFRRLDLPTRDAWAALHMLKLTCEDKTVTRDLVERIRRFLARYQLDPRQRFGESVVFG
jgi:tetratricopeptide (TPR) repeat protein